MSITLSLLRNLNTAKYRAQWHIEEYKSTRRHENLTEAIGHTRRALGLIKRIEALKEMT